MKKGVVLSIFITLLVSACIKDDYFGYSEYGEIKSIEVSNQASQAQINSKTKTVNIEIPGGVDLSKIILKAMTISSFSKADVTIGDTLNLQDSVLIRITSESGAQTLWTIHAFVATENPQLANSDFELWYQSNGGYYEPGESADNTIWGTGNPGSAILDVYATTPTELESGNYAANLETHDNGFLAGTFGAPISAGSIFTGYFNPDNISLTDPQAAIDFGTPFSARPESFKINYSYAPGPENKDKDGTILPYSDGCDIYILLEFRTGNSVQRLATAWFRKQEDSDGMQVQEVPFVYGELPADAPDYSKPENGAYVPQDSASFINPTHLTFVASSSFDGELFSGAIGSLLIIDELELIYE